MASVREVAAKEQLTEKEMRKMVGGREIATRSRSKVARVDTASAGGASTSTAP